MMYLVTLYSCNDQAYEDFWSSDMIIGVFDSYELAEKAVMNDYKERIADAKKSNRCVDNVTEIKKTIVDDETVYECVVDVQYEEITHQWGVKKIEINKPLTKKEDK